MADRDQILAEFQAFTGIEDFEHSVAVLEQHDWNLMEAVQNTMAGMDPAPGEEQPPPAYEQVSSGYEALDSGVIGRRIVNNLQSDDASSGAAGAAAFPDMPTSSATAIGFSAMPSTSGDRYAIRLLNFHVEYRDNTHNLVIPDNEKVEKIKELMENTIDISKDEMQLRGWVTKNDKLIADSDILRDLKLPKENTLFLLTPHYVPPESSAAANGDQPEATDRLSQNFILLVTHTNTGQMYTLNFPGTKTVQEVKGDVYAITNVPARHQIWQGWPNNCDRDSAMTLARSGVPLPSHGLQMRSSSPQPDEPPANKLETVSMSSEDEYLDAQYDHDDDVMFDENEEASTSRKLQPLMPEVARDQNAALESFVREFSSRYGDNHPVFYIGSLENALKDSLQCKARERKLLAVYLHHDGSILTNVFCSQILCADAVISYLCSHFILWAWDLTSQSNKARLISMCTQHFGSVAANTVRAFSADEMPLLLIISRNRATNEVVQVIKGNTTIDELVPQLMHCVEVFQQQQATDITEEDERDAREQIKQEQEMAYMESLAADRLKAADRQAEEDARRAVEKAELEERMRREDALRQEQAEKEAISKSLADQLPDEPPADCGEPISTIRFRAPGNTLIVRRFLAHHPLQVLLNFVASQGYHTEDYKVLTTFPRRDLTQMDTAESLQALKLFPQETITLEEK